MQSKVTDWVQAIGSLAAVIVAAFAYRTSKQSLHAPYRTKINPVASHYQSDSATTHAFSLDNVGPGIAFQVEVRGVVLAGIDEKSIDYYYAVASGQSEIQARSKEVYIFDNMVNVTSFPIIIKYETLTGIKCKELWLKKEDKKGRDFFMKLRFFQKIFFKYFSIYRLGDRKIKRRIFYKPPKYL